MILPTLSLYPTFTQLLPINTTYAKTATLGDKCILYTTTQSLTEEQKAQARANIGAASDSSTGGKYLHQVTVSNGTTFMYASFIFVSDDQTEISRSNVMEKLDGKSFVCINGRQVTSGAARSVVRVSTSNSQNAIITYIDTIFGTGKLETTYFYGSDDIVVYDSVAEL